MKQDIENLIDRLADKGFECAVRWEEGRNLHIYCGDIFPCPRHGKAAKERRTDLDSPVRIGGVLEKINLKCKDEHGKLPMFTWNDINALTGKWQRVGFDKSLQSIFEEAEWEGDVTMLHKPICRGEHQQMRCGCDTVATSVEVPKQKAVRELFEFLLQIFPNETN